ncbi:MAG: TIGR03960 family B12-binding radical SAM protein [Thermodesulfovibrionales bacterium]
MVFLAMNLSYLQKPSRYINNEVNSIHKEAYVKVALAFPDVYEIGMSHLGLRILYKIINDIPFSSAERVFSPWVDLETEMREKGTPLSSLESKRPLRDFDIVGFSLQYELSYTTILNMLFLGGIPLRSEERNNSSCNYPLIIAGGPCTVNPGPMSHFIDAFLIGDGEDAIKEILETYYMWKRSGDGKKESLLKALSEIEGMYVPLVHRSACSAQRLNSFNPLLVTSDSPLVKRRYTKSLNDAPYPDNPIVPYTSIVHDRVNIEVSRGCSRGCRFCQAGIIYRPVRERSPARILEIAENSLKNSGYEEVSFTSLSAGDYNCLLQVIKEFNRRFSKDKIALSLPSLRVGSINCKLLKEISSVRKTGFTIAPEAGTERLRRIINKDFSEEEYERALKALFQQGWHNLKLYFMIGLPTETEEDTEAIPKMVTKALKISKKYTNRFVNINVGISPFVPKPHTPFQWVGQDSIEELKRKKDYLKDILLKKGFNIKDHDERISLLEAALSRGDEGMGQLIEKAWSEGCRLDAWSDVFDFKKWEKAMEITGIDVENFARKEYGVSDVLPWDNIDVGVTKDFLWKENQRAIEGYITPDCRKQCHNCGIGCNLSDMNQRLSLKNNTDQCLMSDETSDNFSPITRYLPLSTTRHFKPVRIRVEFSKTGELIYLSHLELITVMHRAIRRAGLPLVYSEGFHPLPKVSFGPPLSVGIRGLCEYFDIELIPPFDIVLIRRKLNSVLPEGIYIKDMALISSKARSLNSFITRYRYKIRCKNLSHINFFLSEKEVSVKRERGFINLRDMVEEIGIIDDNSVYLTVVDLKESKVRLGELLPKIFGFPMEELEITRVALYGWDGEWIAPLERRYQWIAKS